jgi:hypothetical protein
VATAPEQARTLISRAVIWAGIVLGTALTILAMWNGARLRVPDIPSILSAALGALILWALFMAGAAALFELTVRHHRAVLRHGWRYGKRGGRAAARHAGAAYRGAADRSRPWRTRIITAMRARWSARDGDPLLFTRTTGPDEPATGTPEPVPTRRLGGKPGTGADTRFPGLRGSGYTGPIDQDGYPADTGGTTTMTEPASPAAPAPRGRRVLTIGGTVPGEWKSLVAITADFEPEDDAHLLAWMASEVNGMSAYAEALTEVYETGVHSVGLDPVSLAALHDTADAAADAAQAMAGARQKFAAHYAEVREFAAAGGLLPHDGRWITGEGE